MFRSAIDLLAAGDRPPEPSPGYRRFLGPDESAHWRERFARRWGVAGVRWHPLLPVDVPADVLVLREDAVRDDGILGLLRRALRDAGVRRVVELSEGGLDRVLDVDLFTPGYTGDEGTWSDAGLDWVAHASHEGTLALGGTITAALTAHPDLDRWRWPGW